MKISRLALTGLSMASVSLTFTIVHVILVGELDIQMLLNRVEEPVFTAVFFNNLALPVFAIVIGIVAAIEIKRSQDELRGYPFAFGSIFFGLLSIAGPVVMMVNDVLRSL